MLLLFSRSVVSNSVTPRTVASQASLSFTIFWSLLKLTPILPLCFFLLKQATSFYCILFLPIDYFKLPSQLSYEWHYFPFPSPGGSDGKASACNAGDLGLIPGSGRSPGEGNGNPLQDSCLEKSMDGGAWWATVHGVAKSWTWLSDFNSLRPQSSLIEWLYFNKPLKYFLGVSVKRWAENVLSSESEMAPLGSRAR